MLALKQLHSKIIPVTIARKNRGYRRRPPGCVSFGSRYSYFLTRNKSCRLSSRGRQSALRGGEKHCRCDRRLFRKCYMSWPLFPEDMTFAAPNVSYARCRYVFCQKYKGGFCLSSCSFKHLLWPHRPLYSICCFILPANRPNSRSVMAICLAFAALPADYRVRSMIFRSLLKSRCTLSVLTTDRGIGKARHFLLARLTGLTTYTVNACRTKQAVHCRTAIMPH